MEARCADPACGRDGRPDRGHGDDPPCDGDELVGPSVRRTALPLAALLLGAAGLGWFLLRPAAPPLEAEGRAWLSAFANRLTDRATWAARGPAALALFPGLGPWSTDDCVLAWSNRDPSAAVVTYQRLELGRLDGDACDQAQFGLLSTTLRQSEGITPSALVERFTAQFGTPEIARSAQLNGTISYKWQVGDGIFARMEEPVGPDGGDSFSVLFVHYYGSPTALATPVEAERWMDRTVELVTGPALAAARGPAIIPLLDASMQPSEIGGTDCPLYFDSDPRRKAPIATQESLILEREEGAPCPTTRLSHLSMQVWVREPVTAAAVVGRIGKRLGEPAVSRDFDRDRIGYRWTTKEGLALELLENTSLSGRYWLTLRTWRE